MTSTITNAPKLPTLTDAQALPGGAPLLTLEGGQTVQLPDVLDTALSEPGTVPHVLSVLSGPAQGVYHVPEALRGDVLRALRFPPDDLPTVQSLEALPGGGVRLTLEGGQTVTLTPDTAPRAVFLPETALSGGVFLSDWKTAGAPAYLVPTAHVAALCQIFDEARRPTGSVVPSDTRPQLTGAVLTPQTVTLCADGFQPLHLDRAHCWVSPGAVSPSAPRAAVVEFAVSDQSTPGRIYEFEADSTTPQGAAALLALGLKHEAQPPVIERAELAAANRAVLHIRQGEGLTPWPVAVPVPYLLGGRGNSPERVLILRPDTAQAEAFTVPAEVVPLLAPVLGGQQD